MTTESKKPANKTRLSKANVKEALKQLPIETLLTPKGKRGTLTKKQRTFAHKVAEGLPKAEAYRQSYNSQALPKTQGDEGYRLSLNPAISAEIDAYKIALEAMKYRNAEQTKALIIQQLTQHAINEDNPPQVRLNALKLLGQSYDVGLFVERKQVETISHSGDIKARLLDQLKLAIKGNTIDVEDTSADSLLNELKGAPPIDELSDQGDDPPPPRKPPVEAGLVIHSIPHSESDPKSEDSYKNNNSSLQGIDLEGEKKATLNIYSDKGVGVNENQVDWVDVVEKTPPVNGSKTQG